ncbi:hypothetical protein JI59_04220 [Novosphingobium pentaromativorans US6-1]|nr:hypothetical protein JI59_04220 [Novosphingobium pentaromativorans US6-1]
MRKCWRRKLGRECITGILARIRTGGDNNVRMGLEAWKHLTRCTTKADNSNAHLRSLNCWHRAVLLRLKPGRGRLESFSEKFIHADEPLRDFLFVKEAAQCFYRGAIGFNAIWPEILSKKSLSCSNVMLNPRNADSCRLVYRQISQAKILGFYECLEQIGRNPWITLVNIPPDNDRMHDRKNSGLFIILALYRRHVGKQIGKPRIAGQKRRWHLRCDQSIYRPLQQQVVQTSLYLVLDPDLGKVKIDERFAAWPG